MSRLWLMCFAIMVMAIDCVNGTADPTELKNLRQRLEMVDLRLASGILALRRDLKNERSLRMKLEDTVHQLQRQLQQQKIAINHTYTYIDDISNQVCHLNLSYINACQNYGMHNSGCCLRTALESVQESLKANGLKLSEFAKDVNLHVSFSARVNPSINDINPWDTIVFSDVVHNEGSAYNSANGKFIAPVCGTYVFFSHILGAARALETALKINEDVKLWLYSGDPTYYAPGSNMLIIKMNKGDSARVVKHGPWGDRPFYIHHVWSTFSGFLLSAS